ncbi:SDR family oxidoreductase [Psychromonas sp. RZ22]|uniref:UDP-glucose 4-epimerase family protein n=1 Tax=Psychromonas algarum TaxID=2555643 RepID=UPI001068196F|nr:SDR family oxidoreductase [Psychromonas sp. RZ22]TEW55725.1 SDR family oxidoreductase [Psychromonas sp. RZ22]
MKIILTGATGFLGSFIIPALTSHQLATLGRTRSNNNKLIHHYANLDKSIDYEKILIDFDVLIHCAARVHVMNDESINPLDDYREVNTAGTLNLARQAAEAGVKRFIFISSIKVNGESTELGQAFKASDARAPQDFYGQSKSEAEEQLLKLAEETGMEVVIIRPPLVYGPGVKANFASLLNLVSKGLPLPFGCITNNQRSLVSVNNLVDLIITCIDHPNAANQVFLVSDDNDLSTAGMIKKMSKALGRSSRMLPVPLSLYHLIGKVFGKQDVVNRLLGSLQVDISHTKQTLNWKPIQSVEDGFRETAEVFLKNKKSNK